MLEQSPGMTCSLWRVGLCWRTTACGDPTLEQVTKCEKEGAAERISYGLTAACHSPFPCIAQWPGGRGAGTEGVKLNSGGRWVRVSILVFTFVPHSFILIYHQIESISLKSSLLCLMVVGKWSPCLLTHELFHFISSPCPIQGRTEQAAG